MRNNMKKALAILLALTVCLVLPVSAIAANVKAENDIVLLDGEDVSGEDVSKEDVSKEDVSKEDVSKEDVSKEDESKEDVSVEDASKEDESKEEPSEEEKKDDVIALILKFLGTIKLDEVKDALNDINEALGLPRVESFADMAAYADALYAKLDAMGLGYDDIINAIKSSDFIEWINGILFNNKPTATVPATTEKVDGGNNTNTDGTKNPHTGVGIATAGAAATLVISSALAFALRKRSEDEE